MSNVFTLQRQTDWPVFIINTTGSHYWNTLSSHFDPLCSLTEFNCLKIKWKNRESRKSPFFSFFFFLFFNTWCLGTAKVIFSWVMTHWEPIKQGFSLWSRLAWAGVSVSREKWRKMLLIVALLVVIHQKIGELWAVKCDGFSCFSLSVPEHAVYHVRTFLDGIYCPSAVHRNHDDQIAP